ncbi:ArnT family glycosyltransferase [Microcystis aeruginosa]|uniref:Glycosyl transferase family protein n=1 Tax=Microcystis aeruginosa NIES-3807 TaxID=2517785 RepID=A0AAD3B006_MICAE|nr:glycosyltransferase family 39 protein [Microcystis aeruginosa]GCL58834.1 glycosyl transferase family protein [Microcystis aeruginosa NIES-3807]
MIKDSYIFLGVIVCTIILRAPNLFPSVINWDESTFILMGQSVLDGHLPYLELWDNKPPLLFFIFALFIGIGGKNIVWIRVAGSLFLGISAFFVYKTGELIGTVSTGLIAAIIFIIMTGELGGKAIMSEVIAAVPLTAAFWLMIRSSDNPRSRFYFLLGILLAMATLIRFNLAYLALAIFLYYCIRSLVLQKRLARIAPISFVIGFCLTILLVVIPYWTSGNLSILYRSVLEAPFHYSTSQISRSGLTSHFIVEGVKQGNPILWVSFLGGLILIITKLINPQLTIINASRPSLVIFLLWFLAIALSIASSGNTYSHYIIQILPLMTLTTGLFFSSPIWSRFRYIGIALFGIGLLEIARPLMTEYRSMLTQVKNGTLFQDESYRLADFLRRANPDREPIYLLDDHIAYWLTDTKPLSKIITHPSNINQPALLKTVMGEDATAEKEIANILAKKPLFIAKKSYTWYLESTSETNQLLLEYLKNHYQLTAKIEDMYVYKRR